MAYNNGFPITYPQMMLPQYPQLPQASQPPQGMTLPTIHADIIQIATEQDGWNQQVAPGVSQIMMTKDEQTIMIKSAYPDRQPTMDIYRKEAQKAIPAPSDYVTKDELAAALEALRPAKKAAKEVSNDGTV